jgi:hypothetical protein
LLQGAFFCSSPIAPHHQPVHVVASDSFRVRTTGSHGRPLISASGLRDNTCHDDTLSTRYCGNLRCWFSLCQNGQRAAEVLLEQCRAFGSRFQTLFNQPVEEIEIVDGVAHGVKTAAGRQAPSMVAFYLAARPCWVPCRYFTCSVDARRLSPLPVVSAGRREQQACNSLFA